MVNPDVNFFNVLPWDSIISWGNSTRIKELSI